MSEQLEETAGAQTIDVEQIMREIREQIKSEDLPSVPEFSEIQATSAVPALDSNLPVQIVTPDNGLLQQLANETQFVLANYTVPYFREMGMGVKSLVKRTVRKLVKPVVLPMNEQQNDLNGHFANAIDAIRGTADYHQGQLNTVQDVLNGMHDELDALSEEASQSALTEARIDDLEVRIDELCKSVGKLEESHGQLDQSIGRLDQSIGQIDQSIGRLDKSFDELTVSAARIIKNRMPIAHQNTPVIQPEIGASEAPVDGEVESATQPTSTVPFDYFAFENAFRGTQSDIMERQRRYIPYFKDKKGKVFDLGCGRGEFLRLMKEEGIPAFGADMYPEYEVVGQMYDIDIHEGDGIAMLENMDEKLGGIFCAQVIEHIGFDAIQKLCQLAYQKLEEGAYIVLETPNPMCVSTFTNAFYMDPTHDKPVHPLLMEHILKSMGFSDVQLLWPDQSLEQLPLISSESIENLEEVNQAITRVSNLLFGSQDYAIVAKR